MWPWLLLLYPVRNVDWLDIPGAAGGEIGIFFGVTVAIIYEAAFTVSQTLASPFSDWVAGRKVIRAAAYFASADSTYLSPAKRNWTCLSLIRPPSRGPISLPADALDALDVNSADSWQAPLQFSESVGQWGTDISDFQALWITSHTRNLRDMGAIVRDILLNDVPGPDIALVDVSRSRSPIWPLIHGLTLTSAPYRYRIARSQPEPFSSYFWLNVFRPSTFHGTSGFWDVSPTVANDYDMFDTLVCRPLEAAAERLSKSSHVDHETAYFPGLPPVVLIVHGLRDRKHAEDLYHFITQLRFVRQPVRIVAVSDPSLPRHVFEHNADVLLNTRTLYISDTGSVVYSGRRYQPPFFYEHLFALFVDAMHRSCGTNAERCSRKLSPQLNSYVRCSEC
ncbi:hypothetical protein C8J57DRAFT_531612 [Mycena rebaudengoi]|nr:hypothetical protein C8J57DRAFT_531612 [Mycena rebaudengoi]